MKCVLTCVGVNDSESKACLIALVLIPRPFSNIHTRTRSIVNLFILLSVRAFLVWLHISRLVPKWQMSSFNTRQVGQGYAPRNLMQASNTLDQSVSLARKWNNGLTFLDSQLNMWKCAEILGEWPHQWNQWVFHLRRRQWSPDQVKFAKWHAWAHDGGE